jgi:hypothetical protein
MFELRRAIVSATLRLSREVSYILFGRPFELRRGRFEITLDGTDVGSLENHETIDTPLKPGHHTLRIRKGRYSSRDQSFDAAEGEVVNFNCHGAAIWPTYVASFVKPDVAISLRRK